MFVVLLSLLLGAAWSKQECTSPIYCHGTLLHTVQMARIFADSKTFVDLKMRKSEQEILKNFQNLSSRPSKREIHNFVEANFENFTELDSWTPPDFQGNPKFLKTVLNPEVRKFAQDLVQIWPFLGRKVKEHVLQNPQLFSLVPLRSGFVVPGGRFKEFYYWDTYWVIKGLLLCQMYATVQGMLENFLVLVERYGFIPNGSRVYYLDRSQPPLLALMVANYISATNNTPWLTINIKTVAKELHFWLTNRVTEVQKGNTKYLLAHYSSNDGTPRPESYYEDVKTAVTLEDDTTKTRLYTNIRAAAESGWDFSSRWIVDQDGGNRANLTSTQARRIIPVDLNSFLCKAFQSLAHLYETIDDRSSAAYWREKAARWQISIDKVLYDKADGIWYDFDTKLVRPRKYFYPSNFSPLWARGHESGKSKVLGRRAVKYLLNQGGSNYAGGIPTSLVQSGQQWDLPNAWPPLQHIVIVGLRRSGDKYATEVARQLGEGESDWFQEDGEDV